MNSMVTSLCMLMYAGGVMLMLPHLSPQRLFFGVRVSAGFRTTPPAQAALRKYVLCVLAAFAAGLVLIAALGGERTGMLVAAALLPGFVGIAVLLRLHYRLRPYSAPVNGVREADLSGDEDRLPRWTLLVLPVFLAPLAAMRYLYVHWDQIPARYPVHFNASGLPDGLANRSPLSVAAPLWFAEGMLVLMALLALAIFYGSRPSANRRAILGLLGVIIYVLAFILTRVGLAPLEPFSPLELVVIVPVLVLVLLIWLVRRNADPNQEVELTPDECWTFAGIYSNPGDPAIFVQRRIGWGYTVNFGNRRSWLILGGFLAAVIGLSSWLAWAVKQ